MNSTKPFAASADRNKEAILDALKIELINAETVFEFGSGTGQHIAHFARHLPHIQWQPSDLSDKLPGMQQWFEESACPNILPPITLDLSTSQPPAMQVSACYSANTLHIISWPLVEQMFRQSAQLLSAGGKLCIYGPFRFSGKALGDGNRAFDTQLRNSDPLSGIRNVDDLNDVAADNGFTQARELPLPANNHLLIWDR